MNPSISLSPIKLCEYISFNDWLFRDEEWLQRQGLLPLAPNFEPRFEPELWYYRIYLKKNGWANDMIKFYKGRFQIYALLEYQSPDLQRWFECLKEGLTLREILDADFYANKL